MRTDIENVIKKYKIQTFGFKKNIKNVEKYLREDETVLFISSSNYIEKNNISSVNENVLDIKNKKPAIFVITNNKIILYYKILWKETIIQIPTEELRTYELRKELIFLILRISTIMKSYDIDLQSNKSLKDLELILGNLKTTNANNH